ncbi:TMV resistance protein N-like [Hibiscus syriacus]|uniref:TMV resistance protein N-like n=1 Tax=Hibiscus syriacus TaxID=106335 RepID=A0A6A3CUI7_HIBSY|nr:TMV resistance protein N-like [Hibiscus syriacus]
MLRGQIPPQPEVFKALKKRKEIAKGAKKASSSSQLTCNFLPIMELRKKIIAFRDIFGLLLPNISVLMDQLLIGTMKDLHKFYRESIPNFRISELKILPLDKVLIYFCKAFQGLGNKSKMSDKWIDKYKYDIYDNEKCKSLKIVVETLNGLIKIARERFDMADEDGENKEFCLKAKSFGKILKESYLDNRLSCTSPVRPSSLLSETTNGSPKSSSSVLLPLRVQAVGKLNRIDVKHKQPALDKLPKVRVQVPSSLNQKKAVFKKQKKEAKRNSPVRKASIVDKTRDSTSQNAKPEVPPSNSNNACRDKTKFSPNIALSSSPPEMQPSKLLKDKVVAEKSSPPPLASSSPLPSPLRSPAASPLRPAAASPLRPPSASPPPTSAAAETSLPTPPSKRPKISIDLDTDIKSRPRPPAGPRLKFYRLPSHQSLSGGPPAPSLLPPNAISGRAPAPPLLQPNVVSGRPPLPPPLTSQPNIEAAQATPVATESHFPLPFSMLTNIAAAGIPSPLPRSPPPLTSLKTNVVATGAPLPSPPPVPLSSKVELMEHHFQFHHHHLLLLEQHQQCHHLLLEQHRIFPPLPPPGTVSLMPPPPPSGTASLMPPPPPPGTTLLMPPPPPGTVSTMQPPSPPPGTASTMPPPITPHGTASTMPPPPPGATKSLGPKKANTKLKRSSHMGNLYRVLRGKVEGCPMQCKSSSEKKIVIASVPCGKQGMSDALAEMTKRTFSTNDMTKLLKFHKHAESIPENLTDETQVLARFEGFPTKKLEAIRTASALYSKLESMIAVLQNWKFELPLAELLDKVDHYFNKIKGETYALEQTREEESKNLMSHNIEFDFQILVRIKEAMVDVSSNCMELAMKERREVKLKGHEGSKTKAEAQKKGCVKMLWRAFQLAFRVYIFAGGHDSRADMLSLELADEIQTDPQHTHRNAYVKFIPNSLYIELEKPRVLKFPSAL